MLPFLAMLFLPFTNFQNGIKFDHHISLNSDENNNHQQKIWSFYATQNDSIKGFANVPGDIYTDLHKNGIIDDPLKDINDVAYAWVGRTNWTFIRTFDIPEEAMKVSQIWLRFDGLDTIASVYVNDVLVLESVNQFIDYFADIRSQVKLSGNILKVDFTSPVIYAKAKSDEYKKKFGHIIPPDTPMAIQNGESHPQFIRKSQASFSWDWGPSFPTSGIWRNVWLNYNLAEISIKRMAPLITYEKIEKNFIIEIDFEIFCKPNEAIEFTLESSIPEVSIIASDEFNVLCGKNGISLISHNLTVPEEKIELWWPNGYGNQKLYSLETNIFVSSTKLIAKDQKKVGFRYVELIQDFVDPNNQGKGRHFYFKINSIPIFLKGSNLIETENFAGRNSSFRKNFLLKSVAEANLNSLRVWGGGIYESDEFYSMADEYGILLWHDMLFACSLYPTNPEFLGNVKNETEIQLLRLRYHPSILVWAGNNENELAIQSGWWYAYSRQETLADYIKLYKETIGSVIAEMDPSRPYLLSSPSNGIETEKAGGVGNSPNNEMFGDIHFYNENINLWDDRSYETPRCATEFGVQSIPLRDTMLSYINETEYYYNSKAYTSRQHHTGGVSSLIRMTFSHFEAPKECNGSSYIQGCKHAQEDSNFMASFSYLTQIHQALAMQVQSEHYRRWRGIIDPNNGKGNTMCALYWQLNDVWAGPSWASIDYNLEWKVIHYFAKRFFSPIIVSLYLDGKNGLQGFVVSDKMENISKAELKIDMFSWAAATKGFEAVHSQNLTMDIPALASTKINISGFEDLAKNPSNYLIRATLTNSGDGKEQISPPAILHPDKFIGLNNFGNISISNFQKINEKMYEIEISATNLAPFVWIDLIPEFKEENPFIGFRFSDNAFTATNQKKKVQLLFEVEPKMEVKISDVVVCQLETCFQKIVVQEKKPSV